MRSGLTWVGRRLRWWAQDYAYAGRRQFLALRGRKPDPDLFTRGTRRPVVVIPGVLEDWTFMLPLVRALYYRGHPVHVVTELGWNRRTFEDSADAVEELIRERELDDVVIVAHSKGGLIGKTLMLREAADGPITEMVAVSTPFSGSFYARWSVIPLIRNFSPRNKVLRGLMNEHDVDARITSIYAKFDPHIPEGSKLRGATNIRLDTGGHFRTLAHPTVLATVLEVASDDRPEVD